MGAVERYQWDTPEYADAFATLLRCSDERPYVRQVLRGIFAAYPAEARAVDWGAGGGDLTALLLEHFRTVYAVEPSPPMRAALAKRCPGARLIDGSLGSAELPGPVEVGLISHVYYHIPDHKWGAYTVRAAARLADRGVLVVTLKDPDSGCNRMLEHFGAPRFDLFGSLAGAVRRHRELSFSFLRSPATYRTTTLEETLQIARFMLCDRDADAFSAAPSEEEFREYVRQHFWDERAGRGGWEADVLYCCVRRSGFYGPDGRVLDLRPAAVGQ